MREWEREGVPLESHGQSSVIDWMPIWYKLAEGRKPLYWPWADHIYPVGKSINVHLLDQ